ncbi:hypothetical protein Leryth_021434 [Lithospermum erythrorhizon]|nr:hypothetical protein Leryth_021434 [Lithospermum erythrorhizon]
MTSSGRRVKRKNLDECDGSSLRTNHGRKSTRKRSKKSSKCSRPQRVAARNALNFFSRINGTSKDGGDDSSVGESSEIESSMQGSDIISEESDFSENTNRMLTRKEIICVEEVCCHADTSHEIPEDPWTDAISRRLVLKLSKHSQNSILKFHDHHLPCPRGNQEIHSTHSDPQDSSAKVNSGIDELAVHSGYDNNGVDELAVHSCYDNNGVGEYQSLEENFKPAPTKLKINSNVQSGVESPVIEPNVSLDGASLDPDNTIPEIVDMGKEFTSESLKGELADASNLDTAGRDGMQGFATSACSMPPEILKHSETLHSNDRMFSAAVYISDS